MSISGDILASAACAIQSSGDIDLSHNPLFSVLSGTIGSGPLGHPSSARGLQAWEPKELIINILRKMDERNGFTIVDVYPTHMEVNIFDWGPSEPLDDIMNLQPNGVIKIARNV